MAGIGKQISLFILEIIDWEYDDRPTGEEQVEALIEQVIVESNPWKEGKVAKADNGDHKNDVLVEHKANQKTIPSVCFSAMYE